MPVRVIPVLVSNAGLRDRLQKATQVGVKFLLARMRQKVAAEDFVRFSETFFKPGKLERVHAWIA